MGINTITENDDLMKADNCSQAPLFVTTYLVFNVVYNILIVVILKHGSANILWMASTAIVPLSNVAFSLNIMPGHQPLKIWDIIGLFVIMFGLVLYRFMNSITSCFSAKASPDDDDSLRTVRAITKKAEARQSKYVGFNQIEALNSLIDTRVMKERKVAFYRSPQQIRGSLLLRLGIPPSPLFSISPKTREMSISPTITEVPQNQQNVNLLKKTNIPIANKNMNTNYSIPSATASSIPKSVTLSNSRAQQMVTSSKSISPKDKDNKQQSSQKKKGFSNEV
jgi:hypothetical protein